MAVYIHAVSQIAAYALFVSAAGLGIHLALYIGKGGTKVVSFNGFMNGPASPTQVSDSDVPPSHWPCSLLPGLFPTHPRLCAPHLL